MKCIAPGKLILSGEHAVLYGCPVLAIAINRYLTVTLTELNENTDGWTIDVPALHFIQQVTRSSLLELLSDCQKRYGAYQTGALPITRVIQEPLQLLKAAVAAGWDESMTTSYHLSVNSTIPLGGGMGSSAAMISAVLYVLKSFGQIDLQCDSIFELARSLESLQHGRSSGIDLQVAMKGGCLFVKDGVILSRPVTSIPIYGINTGKPSATTGECVAAAASHFQDPGLCRAFTAVTEAMDEAYQKGDQARMMACIHENHQLLIRIGVVSEKVEKLIKSAESVGAVGKIAGAGTNVGDACGMVYLMGGDEATLSEMAKAYHFTLETFQVEKLGVHLV